MAMFDVSGSVPHSGYGAAPFRYGSCNIAHPQRWRISCCNTFRYPPCMHGIFVFRGAETCWSFGAHSLSNIEDFSYRSSRYRQSLFPECFLTLPMFFQNRDQRIVVRPVITVLNAIIPLCENVRRAAKPKSAVCEQGFTSDRKERYPQTIFHRSTMNSVHAPANKLQLGK